MSIMERVTQWINEEKRKQFNSQRMTQLVDLTEDVPAGMELYVPGRQHLSEGMYRISDSVAMEGLPLVKLIIFNDMIFWVKTNRRSEMLKYDGHMMFNRATRVERIGLDLVRVENPNRVWLIQSKDLVTAEHLYSVLFEAVKSRHEILEAVHTKRVASAQAERERLRQQVNSMELELIAARRTISASEKQIATLKVLIESLCAKTGDVADELLASAPVPTENRSPPMMSAVSSSVDASPDPSAAIASKSGLLSVQQGTPVLRHKRRLSQSPKMMQLPVGEFQPFVVIANQDYVSDDPEELSFSFGELIFVTEDHGKYFMGRPLEGEVFAEKKVFEQHVSLMAKRGNTYVRVDSATSSGSSGNVIKSPAASSAAGPSDRRSGSFRDASSRSVLLRSVGGESRKSGRASADPSRKDDRLVAPSPSAFRKKTGSERGGSRIALKESSGFQDASFEGHVDHSQEVILKQGWLRKIGGARKNWKRRFFFLSESLLYYYETDKIVGKKPLGIVPLKEALAVERSKRYDDGFQIPLADRMWEFRADSVEESHEWFQALQQVVSSSQEPGGQTASPSPAAVPSVASPVASSSTPTTASLFQNPLFGKSKAISHARSRSSSSADLTPPPLPPPLLIVTSPASPEPIVAVPPAAPVPEAAPPADESESISTVEEAFDDDVYADL